MFLQVSVILFTVVGGGGLGRHVEGPGGASFQEWGLAGPRWTPSLANEIGMEAIVGIAS